MLRSSRSSGVLIAVLVCAALPAAWAAAATLQREQSREPAAPLFPPDGRVETRHLTLRTSTSVAAASPGARVTLRVAVTPKPKMHIYAPEQKDVIPVTLVLTSSPDVRPGTLRFPPSDTYFFAPLEETQRVYSKPFEIAQEITIADTRPVRARAGAGDTITISGRLRYQACDDTICYLPQDVPVSWTITLEPPA
jgi:hypothetical protein